MMETLLCASGLGFRFRPGAPPLFDEVDLALQPGQVTAIIGPSGSGKTTLCHCLSGIIPLLRGGETWGSVTIKGKPVDQMRIPEIARNLGMVSQDPEAGLFFPVVEDEVAFGPENLCLEPPVIRARIDEALGNVGITDLRLRNPHRLSGGEKQLVATASVLSLHPEILILDEALSQLDGRGRWMMERLILRLRATGKAILMVTHDPNHLDVADHTFILSNGRLSPFHGDWAAFPAGPEGAC